MGRPKAEPGFISDVKPLAGGGWTFYFYDLAGARQRVQHEDRKTIEATHRSVSAELAEGVAVSKGPVLFSRAAAEYVEHSRQTKSAASVKRITSSLNVWILPRWGSKPIAGIEAVDIQKWVRWLSTQTSERTGRPLGAMAVRGIYDAFAGVMTHAAVEHGHIPYTPCRGIKRPGIVRRVISPDSLADAWALADKLDERYRLLVEVGMLTATRANEMLALRRDDIVRGDRPLIRVRRQLRTGGFHVRATYKPPKGNKTRTVIVDPSLIDALDAHWSLYGVEKNNPDGLLFTDEDGWSIGYTRWRRYFLAAKCDAGVERTGEDAPFDLTPHSLRHLHVGYARRLGGHTSQIKDQAGHSSEAVTESYGIGLDHDADYVTALTERLRRPSS